MIVAFSNVANWDNSISVLLQETIWYYDVRRYWIPMFYNELRFVAERIAEFHEIEAFRVAWREYRKNCDVRLHFIGFWVKELLLFYKYSIRHGLRVLQVNSL